MTDVWNRSSWYVQFNLLEGLFWMMVAAVIALRVPAGTFQQRFAVLLAALAFVVFGVTDWLESRYEAKIPLWLWALKIACGCTVLAARYTWRGWHTFRWRDRELGFGVFCLMSVFALIWLQSVL